MERPVRSLRSDSINAAVLCLAVMLMWAPRLRGPIDLRWDAATYYQLGTSLAEGKGYRLPNEPGEIRAIQYPPALPSIVAIHQRALGTSDCAVVGKALRFTYLAIYFGYILGVYALARSYLPPAFGLLVALITCTALYSVFMSNLLFAEIPFALASVAFAVVHRRGGGAGRTLASAVLGGVAYLLRTAGIALLAAWVLESLVHRDWKQVAIRSVLALIPVVAWQAYIGAVRSSEEYKHPAYPYQRAPYQFYNVSYAENLKLIDPFVPDLGRVTPAVLAKRLVVNLASMPVSLGESIVWAGRFRASLHQQGFRLSALPLLLGKLAIASLGLAAAAGLVMQLRRGEWVVPTYVALSVVIIALTPWPAQFARYLTPLTPFLTLAACECLLATGRLLQRRWLEGWGRIAPALVAVLFGLIVVKNGFVVLRSFDEQEKALASRGIRQDTLVDQLLFSYDSPWIAFDDAIAWIGAHAGRGAIVASSTPQWVYLRTGLKAVLPPMEPDMAQVQSLLDAVPVEYLIVESMGHSKEVRRFLKGVVEAFPDRWELAYRAPQGEGLVYRRTGTRPKPPSGADAAGGATGGSGPGRPGNVEPPRGAK